MKFKRYVPAALVLLLFMAVPLYSADNHGHYFDAADHPLPQYDFLYDELTRYFKDSVPEKIIVKHTSRFLSGFDAANEAVLLDATAANQAQAGPIDLVGHESCHLCMENFTKGASVEEEFRFFDEGFAVIFQNMLAQTADDYKKTALTVAALQNLKYNVSFAKVQKWYDYFFIKGSQAGIHFYAFPVASSFVYFVMDSYGIDAFFAFCKDIGDTRNLDRSCQNVFRKDQMTIESEWCQYLNKVSVSTTQIQPRILKMSPENKATRVSIKTTEIWVEFDIPMSRNISVISDSEGVSYKNAYWKTDKILAVKVNLLANHLYNISLGRASGNKLMSKDYVELPPTQWSFTTGSE
jgi:hypothetical protein